MKIFLFYLRWFKVCRHNVMQGQNSQHLTVYLFIQIEIDFEAIFGEVADTLFLKWTPAFAEKVMAYATTQANWQSYLHVDMQKVNSGKL